MHAGQAQTRCAAAARGAAPAWQVKALHHRMLAVGHVQLHAASVVYGCKGGPGGGGGAAGIASTPVHRPRQRRPRACPGPHPGARTGTCMHASETLATWDGAGIRGWRMATAEGVVHSTLTCEQALLADAIGGNQVQPAEARRRLSALCTLHLPRPLVGHPAWPLLCLLCVGPQQAMHRAGHVLDALLLQQYKRTDFGRHVRDALQECTQGHSKQRVVAPCRRHDDRPNTVHQALTPHAGTPPTAARLGREGVARVAVRGVQVQSVAAPAGWVGHSLNHSINKLHFKSTEPAGSRDYMRLQPAKGQRSPCRARFVPGLHERRNRASQPLLGRACPRAQPVRHTARSQHWTQLDSSSDSRQFARAARWQEGHGSRERGQPVQAANAAGSNAAPATPPSKGPLPECLQVGVIEQRRRKAHVACRHGSQPPGHRPTAVHASS